jgi:hypothetical protein
MLGIGGVEMEKKKEVYQCQSMAPCAYIHHSKGRTRREKFIP